MKQASKSQKRIDFLEVIREALSSPVVFEHIDYETKTVAQCKKFFHSQLVEHLSAYASETLEMEEDKIPDFIEESLDFSEDNNIMFMGTKNDPFLVIDMHGVKTAVELKKGKRGIDLKDCIAQSMIYSTHFDFVLYLFMDVSEEKRIVNSQGGVNEKSFVNELWKSYNIKLIIA